MQSYPYLSRAHDYSSGSAHGTAIDNPGVGGGSSSMRRGNGVRTSPGNAGTGDGGGGGGARHLSKRDGMTVDVKTVSGRKSRKVLKEKLVRGVPLQQMPSQKQATLAMNAQTKMLSMGGQTLHLDDVVEIREGMGSTSMQLFKDRDDLAEMDSRIFSLITFHEDHAKRESFWELECLDGHECRTLVEEFRYLIK